MKAYSVYDARSLDRLCDIVYANTPAQAKGYALAHSETFSGATWDARRGQPSRRRGANGAG